MFTNKIRHKNKWCEEQCFMIMPFAQKYNEVFNIIRRAAQKCGIKILRADSKNMPLPISAPFVEKIKKLINQSYYIIADISELNPNVLYELGLSHALLPQDDVLLIMNETTECPSDLYHINYVKYNSTQLSYLYDRVAEFLGGGAYKQDLINHLEHHDLIPQKIDRNSLFEELKKTKKVLLALFNNVTSIEDETANILLVDLHEKCCSPKIDVSYRDCYHGILIFSLGRLIRTNNLDKFINTNLNIYKYNDEFTNLDAEIAIEIIKVIDNNVALKWIMDLLSKIPTTSVNIAKYTVMLGLLRNDRINRVLISWINNNDFIDKDKQLFLEEILEICIAKNFSIEEKHKVLEETIKLSKNTNNEYVLNAAIKLVLHLDEKQYIKNEIEAIQSNPCFKELIKNEFILRKFNELSNRIDN